MLSHVVLIGDTIAELEEVEEIVKVIYLVKDVKLANVLVKVVNLLHIV